MKINYNIRFIFLAMIMVLVSGSILKVNAQEVKKSSVRIKADYVKTMNKEVTFKIKATSKVDNQNVDVSNIPIIVSNEYDDNEVELGSIITNMDGSGKFVIKDYNLIKPDSSGLYTVNFSFKGNDTFKRASKSVSYKDASIEAKIIVIDSVHYITATLKDTAKDSLLSEQLLNVQVQRLFRNLRIGEEFNSTDENGTIIVPIEEGIPGVDGNLTFEVVLLENDDYGTVKTLVTAPLGVPIVDQSTFDDRKMWSPRNKTPIFLLIFPNLVIFGMWAFIIYLFINLFKISKSKI